MILWRLPIENNLSILPRLEIVRESTDREQVLVLSGSIEWDGITRPQDPEELLRAAFEATFGEGFTIHGFLFTLVTKDSWRLDAPLMRAHGLRYALTESESTPDGHGKCKERRLVTENNDVQETNMAFRSFPSFFSDNVQYLRDLGDMFRDHTAYLKL
jgi:hypothetical protein